MRQTLKMHRPTAVAAAVLMILTQVLNTAASFSTSGAFDAFFPFRLLSNILIAVTLSVILFRGKKDTVAGAVFLILIIAPLVSASYHLLSVLLVHESVFYPLACALSAFVTAAFYGLSAGECLSQGKVSAGSGRVLLWVLPTLCFCIAFVGQMSLCLDDGMNTVEAVTSSLIFMISRWLGPILMGMSLATPEEQKIPK